MRVSVTTALLGTLVGVSSMAPAQLLGARAGVGLGVNTPAIDSTVRGTTDAARGATDSVRDTARSTATVKVEAGTSTRVDRGSRCYYQPDNYYHDPVYRDGYYYCEQRGGAVGARAGAEVSPRP